MAQLALIDSFEFDIVGAEKRPFGGYVSGKDKTTIAPNIIVRGSQNVYKKQSGTWAVRPGLKQYDPVDATAAGVDSSFEWYTSFNRTYPIRVANNKMQVLSDITGTKVWYDLFTGLTTTRWVWDSWWDVGELRDRMIAVGGDHNLYSWSGGIGTVASATANSITLAANGTSSVIEQGFDAASDTTHTRTLVISGIEYTYTAAGVSNSNVYSVTSTNETPTISTTNWVAQKFTTSANATQIRQIEARFIAGAIGTTNATFVCALYTNNAGVPGTRITSATAVLTATFSAGAFPIFFTLNQAVSPNTDYHIVIYAKTIPVSFTTNTGNTPASGTTESSDSGATWSARNGQLYATITENIVSPLTFVGVSPNPSAIPVGTAVVQKPIITYNTPSSTFVNDFIRVINNQLHVGSYSSNLVYISSDTDFTNFTVPATRAPGDPELLTLDNQGKGIGVRQGKAHIGAGTSDWYIVSFNRITVGSTLTEQTIVDKQPQQALAAPLGHEFIDSVGDNIVFLAQDNQLRSFGTFRNLNQSQYPSLSLQLKDELMDQDFTGGHIRAIGDIIYLVSPISGRDYMHETRQTLDLGGNIVSERFWHPPQIRNLSRFAVIDSLVYGYSNSRPQLYEVWDTLQWHDDSPDGESIPYTTVIRMAYRSNGRRQGLWAFDKAYYEGYISPGSFLSSIVRFNYQGASGVQEHVINDPDNDNLLTSKMLFNSAGAPSLGDGSLGDFPLGDGLSPEANDQELLPKFKVITDINSINCFEYQLELYSNIVDSRWELLCLGTNAQVVSQNATFLRK